MKAPLPIEILCMAVTGNRNKRRYSLMAENIEEKGKWKLLPTIGFLAFLVALIVAIIGGIVAPDNSGLILT